MQNMVPLSIHGTAISKPGSDTATHNALNIPSVDFLGGWEVSYGLSQKVEMLLHLPPPLMQRPHVGGITEHGFEIPMDEISSDNNQSVKVCVL